MSYLVWGSLALACSGEYPIAPTYCDDWCRVTLNKSDFDYCSDDTPAWCVKECEKRRALPRCEAEERGILECYQTNPSAIQCGFGHSGVCEEAIQALVMCEQGPRIAECIERCEVSDRTAPPAKDSAGFEAQCAMWMGSCEDDCATMSEWVESGFCIDRATYFVPDSSAKSRARREACFEEFVAACFPE